MSDASQPAVAGCSKQVRDVTASIASNGSQNASSCSQRHMLQDFVALARASLRRLSQGLPLATTVAACILRAHPPPNLPSPPLHHHHLLSGAGAAVFDEAASARCLSLAELAFEGA